MSGEQWRPVPGYEGFYEVSDHGAVRSLDRRIVTSDGRRQMRPGRVLAPAREADGRRMVALCVDRQSRSYRVSVLVLEAFVGPRPEGMFCCHNNGDCTDDRVDNLRWATPSENVLDMIHHGSHHLVNKTHCPRRHPLVAPNLIPSTLRSGGRGCLACNRASSRWHRARKRGYSFDREAEADLIFTQIMEAAHDRTDTGSA